MSDNQNSNVLCEGCGEAFSNFLQEMADQNAKVATCPKCGKIHPLTPPVTLTPPVAAGRTALKGQARKREHALKRTS
ncbi:MAG TPA: hypothetical protein VK828_03290 [Terriglobales bacterium]|jgi:hypothetical protein|nr:hypothetical protein [Terriglobales bacterium]